MRRSDIWVERGADGRPYYVRERTKLPSLRSLLADALKPRRRAQSYPPPRSRRDYHVIPAPLNTPVGPLQLHTCGKMSPTPKPVPFDGRPVQQPETMYCHYHPPPPDNKKQAPPPIYYPQYVPTASAPAYAAPAPPYPVGLPPLPPGARFASPPRLITPDDLKYKCCVCGRVRSPKYHFKHPIPKGQLPGPTVCRKCRKSGTDSENSSHDTPRRYRRVRSRSNSGGRSRSEEEIVVSEPGRGRIIRRLSGRIGFASRSRSRGDRYSGRSQHRSSSLDSDFGRLLALDEDDRRSRRNRSSSRVEVERIRYRDASPPSPKPVVRETVYIIDRPRGRSRSRYESDNFSDYEEREDGRAIRRQRIMARAPTPGPDIFRRQNSDRAEVAPRRTEHTNYFNDSNLVELTTEVFRPPRPVSRSSSRSRSVVSIRREPIPPERVRQISESDEYEVVTDPDGRRHYLKDVRPEEERGHHHWRRHSRRRREIIDDEDHVRRHPAHRFPRPPSPLSPLRTTPAPRWLGTSDHGEAFNRYGQPAMPTQRRAPSRSREVRHTVEERRAARPAGHRRSIELMPGDEVIEIERRNIPNEDYDWYDKDGMRVRVREI